MIVLALRLVKVRAEAMQLASEVTSSGMATVIYGPDSRLGPACHAAKEFCESQGIEKPECSIANYLFPHCKVVAGHEMVRKFVKYTRIHKTKKYLTALHTVCIQAGTVPNFKKL